MTEVLRLRAAGLTYLEISAETGLTRNNVAQYLHRAKKLYK
ncbi:sigma factor-like helix-turn-helix DNA-binding protein [Enterobacter roggenkampii]